MLVPRGGEFSPYVKALKNHRRIASHRKKPGGRGRTDREEKEKKREKTRIISLGFFSLFFCALCDQEDCYSQ